MPGGMGEAPRWHLATATHGRARTSLLKAMLATFEVASGRLLPRAGGSLLRVGAVKPVSAPTRSLVENVYHFGRRQPLAHRFLDRLGMLVPVLLGAGAVASFDVLNELLERAQATPLVRRIVELLAGGGCHC